MFTDGRTDGSDSQVLAQLKLRTKVENCSEPQGSSLNFSTFHALTASTDKFSYLQGGKAPEANLSTHACILPEDFLLMVVILLSSFSDFLLVA